MAVLLHICCGPCSIRVIQTLVEQGRSVTGFFYNPNIQPLSEYVRRRQGAKDVCAHLGIDCIMGDELPIKLQLLPLPADIPTDTPIPREDARYGATWADARTPELPPAASPNQWLQAVAHAPERRCAFCCGSRLEKTAQIAALNKFSFFSTSLLYSRWQQHEPIKKAGEIAATAHGVPFLYQDFRKEWQSGITLSKEWGIYRQQYCGCVFSEYERYAKDLSKVLSKTE